MTAKKNHTAGCVKSPATGGGKLVVRRGEGDPLPSIASRTRFLRQPPRFPPISPACSPGRASGSAYRRRPRKPAYSCRVASANAFARNAAAIRGSIVDLRTPVSGQDNVVGIPLPGQELERAILELPQQGRAGVGTTRLKKPGFRGATLHFNVGLSGPSGGRGGALGTLPYPTELRDQLVLCSPGCTARAFICRS